MFSGHSMSVWEDEKVREVTAVTAAQQCERAEYHRTGHLKMVKTVSFSFHVFYPQNYHDKFFLKKIFVYSTHKSEKETTN